MSNLFTPTYLYNKALPPSNKHSLNTFQQQRIDQTSLFLLYSNSRYSATISNLTIKHTYKPKAPLWAKNTHPPLLTFSCLTGNNKPFRLLITLLCFGNATSMTFSASSDTPKINYTLLFNTSIPSPSHSEHSFVFNAIDSTTFSFSSSSSIVVQCYFVLLESHLQPHNTLSDILVNLALMRWRCSGLQQQDLMLHHCCSLCRISMSWNRLGCSWLSSRFSPLHHAARLLWMRNPNNIVILVFCPNLHPEKLSAIVHPCGCDVVGDACTLYNMWVYKIITLFVHFNTLSYSCFFTKLETAEFSLFLVTVIFIGKYTSRELVVQFVTDKKVSPIVNFVDLLKNCC